MLDSIYIGMSGLMGYSRGLRVIANNTANINTPGFKGASLQFGDMFCSNGSSSGGLQGAVNPPGQGLATYSTNLDFSQGDMRQTANPLDLAVDGQGLFMVKDAAGETAYTRDGEFEFNASGVLVTRTTGAKVLARDGQGALTEVTLDGKRTNAAKPTSTVNFSGNLSVNMDTYTVSDVSVLDTVGTEHKLTLKFDKDFGVQAGRWKVTVSDGATTVHTGALQFNGGQISSADSKISFRYKVAGSDEIPLALDFATDVTSFSAGTSSTLALTRQDGYASGALNAITFDADGVMSLAYSNGQSRRDVRLALGRFDSADAIAAAGANTFKMTDPSAWQLGVAKQGAFGSIKSGVVEISNVDLSSEFSNLVIMQRGYQASSQVVSTANDMLQELFSLKGR